VGGGIVGSFIALNLSEDYEVHWILGGPTRSAAAWGSGGLIQPGSGSLFQKYQGISQLLKWILSERSVVRMSPSFLWRERRWLSVYAEQGRSSNTTTTEATALWRAMASESLKEIESSVQTQMECDSSKELLQCYRDPKALRANRYALLKSVPSVRFREVGSKECRELEPELTQDVVGGFLFEDDLWINPAELLDKMRSRLAKSTTIHDERVGSVATEAGKVAELALGSESLKTDDYVFATGASLPELLKDIGLEIPIVPAWGHMITLRPNRRVLQRTVQIGESRMVIAQTRDSLIRASASVELAPRNHSFPPRRYRALKKMASGAVPMLVSSDITDTWSGMRPVTPDGLPIIGRSSKYENLLIAGGHGRLGVTLAPATGRMVKQMLSSERIEGAQFLSPARFGL